MATLNSAVKHLKATSAYSQGRETSEKELRAI